ncbi:MAG: AAA family ATPase, partial [Gammaproteobacteria bacterium]
MLLSLHLKNLAIVDSADLELNPGMTAITGETGVGKSILIDGLSLVLG